MGGGSRARGLTVGSGVGSAGPGRRLCRPMAPRPGGASRRRHGGSASEPRPPRSASCGPVGGAPRQRKPAEVSPTLAAVAVADVVIGAPVRSGAGAVRDARGVPRGEPLALRYGTPVRSRSASRSRGRHGARPLGAPRGSCRGQRPGTSPHGLGGQRFGNRWAALRKPALGPRDDRPKNRPVRRRRTNPASPP